jgi:hypothetical protein
VKSGYLAALAEWCFQSIGGSPPKPDFASG